MIREREAAKAAYTQARQQGQRASLVEQERPNVFTTSVANIPPGAAITIEIEYQQTVALRRRRVSPALPDGRRPALHPGRAASAAAGGAGLAPDTDAGARRVAHHAAGAAAATRARSTRSDCASSSTPACRWPPWSPRITRSTRRRSAATATRSRWPSRPVAADRDFELVWRPVAGRRADGRAAGRAARASSCTRS